MGSVATRTAHPHLRWLLMIALKYILKYILLMVSFKYMLWQHSQRKKLKWAHCNFSFVFRFMSLLSNSFFLMYSCWKSKDSYSPRSVFSPKSYNLIQRYGYTWNQKSDENEFLNVTWCFIKVRFKTWFHCAKNK